MRRDSELYILSFVIADENPGKVFSQIDALDIEDESIRGAYQKAKGLWMETGTTDFTALAHLCNEKETNAFRYAAAQYFPSMDIDAHIGAFNEAVALDKVKALAEKLKKSESLEDVMRVDADIQKVTRGSAKTAPISYADLMDKFLTRKMQKLVAYETGYPRLDSNLVISPGDFVILAGEQSSGKTAFSLEMMNRFSKKGYRCVYFSLETEPYKLGDRLLTNYSDLTFANVKRQDLSSEDWEKLDAKLQEIKKLPGMIVSAAGKTVEWIKAEAIRLDAQIIFIDYLGLIQPKRDEKDLRHAIASISLDLHTLAQTEGITVIALQQQSRSMAGDSSMHSLRDSSQLESDADAILILTIPDGERDGDEYVPEWTEFLNIAKNKDGDRVTIPFRFNGAHQRFYEQVRM